jgi:hypothetical protein
MTLRAIDSRPPFAFREMLARLERCCLSAMARAAHSNNFVRRRLADEISRVRLSFVRRRRITSMTSIAGVAFQGVNARRIKRDRFGGLLLVARRAVVLL